MIIQRQKEIRMKNADKPVNPQFYSNWNSEGHLQEIVINDDQKGLTKREYFAGPAMQGMLQNSSFTKSFIATTAVRMADELLFALEQKPTEDGTNIVTGKQIGRAHV